MHGFKDNPEAAQPIMNVLKKDLAAAGIEARYSVDSPTTAGADGPAEKSGMFGLSTAKTPQERMTEGNTTMCMYTNPASHTWADNEIPREDGHGSPNSIRIPSEQAFKEIGGRVLTAMLAISKRPED